MSFEDRLSESLARNLDQLEVPAGDVGAARRAGERQRRQRRWTTGIAAAAVVAVVATGVVVARSGDDGNGRLDPAPDSSSWTRLPDAPISPRTHGIAVWTGTEAIFLGGEIDNLCPPNASCVEDSTYAKDGAAYDPVAGTWRRIAPAPFPVGGFTRSAVVGDTLVVVGPDGGWYAYEASDDRWRELPAQPDGPRDPGLLSAADGRVYALGRGDVVQVLDMRTEEWSSLPRSGNEPRIDAHLVLATPEGIVVIGPDSTAKNDGSEPSWVLAEVYDRGADWTRLPRSHMIGSWAWFWTGERLVAPTSYCEDGGEVDGYGACLPLGGILDPGTGTWSKLPDAPEPREDAWGSLQGNELAAWQGFLYDDATGAWTKIPVPKGAPDYQIAAVWADREIIAFGGLDSEKGWDKDALSNQAWSWTP